MNIPVVYEDDWLLVADKPAGLMTIPAPKKGVRTLTGVLNEELRKKGVSYRLHPCHRLDRETSGLIIYAKGKSIQRKMMEQFRKRRVKKTYIGFIHGRINQDSGQIKRAIDGRYALTRFCLLQRRKNFSILEILPITGRKNQIRIHFKGIGHPLVGEAKYAFRRDFLLRAKRVCLHAKSLQFGHPITGKTVSIASKLPADLTDFLDKHK